MLEHVGGIGDGQLFRMQIQAARAMNRKYGYHYEMTVLGSPDSPAGLVADRVVEGGILDPEAIKKLVNTTDVVTFEIEHINARAAEQLESSGAKIYPSPATLLRIQDKLTQKQNLQGAGIPVAPFLEVKSPDDIHDFLRTHGPLVLKRRFGGYDGKGNVVINSDKDISPVLNKLGLDKLYAEQKINFLTELAIMGARSLKGDLATYDLVETTHTRNICQEVVSPSSQPKQLEAEDILLKTMAVFPGVGVLACELFLTEDGQLFVNEVAPRVHNSYHLSIEGHLTSQFEQHHRAITDLELGPTQPFQAAAMVNILGDRQGPAHFQITDGGYIPTIVFIHLYSKKETRYDRKMGHVTALAGTPDHALSLARTVRKRINI